MVICFYATAEAKRSLDSLLGTGQFRDTSEVISMALINYEVLQRSVPGGGPSRGVVAFSPRALKPGTPGVSPRAAKPAVLGPQLPELFFLNSSAAEGVKLATVPMANPGGIANLSPARWLFGQYNKFLPAKATCRALLNLLRQRNGGVVLGEAIKTISQAAWELGDYLYELDQQASRQREDAFAAAFPTTASNGAGSRIRFANQFVGDLRQPKRAEGQPKETKFNGFPSALKFLVCSDGKNPLLELTTAGAEFALLRNPIFDAGQEQAACKFSAAEIEFLLAHITRSVPEEASAYFSIIDAVAHGANTPDKVDEFLCKRFDLQVVANAENPDEITQTFLTTQRTGAISRMVDLGLLARKKACLRVTYLATRTGERFQRQTKQ